MTSTNRQSGRHIKHNESCPHRRQRPPQQRGVLPPPRSAGIRGRPGTIGVIFRRWPGRGFAIADRAALSTLSPLHAVGVKFPPYHVPCIALCLVVAVLAVNDAAGQMEGLEEGRHTRFEAELSPSATASEQLPTLQVLNAEYAKVRKYPHWNEAII